MNRTQRIEDLFEAALPLETAARTALLAKECGAEAELRAEIIALLNAHAAAQKFFAQPASADAAKLLADDDTDAFVNRRLGSYQLLREIGRGGMGTVYLATRADAQYKQRVAIKLIRRGLDTEDIVRRFRNERQILAGLDHPNIAKLLDGGTTEDGLPYFVMEYIEGQPLDAYCDLHKLTTVERLELFRVVCAAVHYAHQNLVVHRDLKPGNILITAAGVPKLLDFGIAKLLNPELSVASLAPTATLLRMMTPDYGSPEQVRGEQITTASDVYSLGVLLYELLTGHRPYRVKSSRPDEVLRVVCEQAPERPSTAINRIEEIPTAEGRPPRTLTPAAVSEARGSPPERLRRLLAGDLDNIVLMSLRKEARRRYTSVEQFSEDIRRYLAGLPVLARRATLAYRSTKFIMRYKAGVAAAALIVLTLVAGLLATAWQARIAAGERDRARKEAAKAERINAFLREMLSSANPSKYSLAQGKGRGVTMVEVLGEAAKRLELELAGQPEIKVELHQTIGNAYADLGLYPAAERHLQAALELRRQLFGEAYLKSAEGLDALARLQFLQGDYAAAEQFYRRALASQRAHPNEGELLPQLLQQLADALHWKGDPAAAEPLFLEALALQRQKYGNSHIVVCILLVELSSVRNSLGDLAGAEARIQEALAVYQQLPTKPPGEMHWLLQFQGFIYLRKGEYQKAEPLLRQALEIRRKIQGEHHPGVATVLAYLAELLCRQQDYVQARAAINRALEIQRQTLAEGHPDLAYVLSCSGLILTRLGEHARAEAQLREALSIQRRRLLKGHWHTSVTLGALGECLTAQRRYAEAEPLLVESYTSFKANQGDSYSQTVEARERLVSFYKAWGKPDLAAPFRALPVQTSP